MHPSQQISKLGKLEVVGATADETFCPEEQVQLPKPSSMLLSCLGDISSLTLSLRCCQSPCSSHPSSLLPAQAEQPPERLCQPQSTAHS